MRKPTPTVYHIKIKSYFKFPYDYQKLTQQKLFNCWILKRYFRDIKVLKPFGGFEKLEILKMIFRTCRARYLRLWRTPADWCNHVITWQADSGEKRRKIGTGFLAPFSFQILFSRPKQTFQTFLSNREQTLLEWQNKLVQ